MGNGNAAIDTHKFYTRFESRDSNPVGGDILQVTQAEVSKTFKTV